MFIRRKFLGQASGGELEDIRENLEQLLSTKRGTGHFLPNFGITEAGYRTPAEMLEGLTREIRENIRLFEPRLTVVEIEDDYRDDGAVHLVVNCRVTETNERVSIVMGPHGRLLRIGADAGEIEED